MEKIIVLVVAALLMAGCDEETNTRTYQADGVVFNVKIIDSCEYISGFRRLAHKGNCRFCEERRNQELKELVEQLKESK